MDQLVLQVNSNGFLTFDSGSSRYSPYRFPGGTRNIVSPFWTDLENRYSGTISYREYNSGSVLQQASTDINLYFPGISFSASWVFVATWDKVEYYWSSGTVNYFLRPYYVFWSFINLIIELLSGTKEALTCNGTGFEMILKSKTTQFYDNQYSNILLLSHYPRKSHSKWSWSPGVKVHLHWWIMVPCQRQADLCR